MTDSGVGTIPRPITPGMEMEALKRFHQDVTWEGHIHEGGMGPGTPFQTARGRATHHLIQNGRWIVGEFEQDQFVADGTFILKWELHWVCGWDPANHEYRATVADCYGHAEVMRGRIDGDIMVFESMRDVPPMLKMTWDASSPDVMSWRNEVTFDGVHWQLIEEYPMVPID